MLSLRLLARDWRAGELRLLLAAVTMAVTIVVGIAAFVATLGTALTGQSNAFIAADGVVTGPTPIVSNWRGRAESAGLRTARVVEFPSMLMAGEATQLAHVRAVSPDYPLRGRLKRRLRPEGPLLSGTTGPGPGEIWLSRRLFALLTVAIGDTIEIGDTRLRITAILESEPDHGSRLFALAPPALMALADLPATGLVRPGSRIEYRYLFAGAAQSLAAYRRWLEPLLAPGQGWIDVREAQPRIGHALERAERYLLLAGSLGVALAGVVIALSARRYSERHIDHVALMRCLGCRNGEAFLLHLQQLAWLGLIGVVIGGLFGWLLEYGLGLAVAQAVTIEPEPPGPWPLALGALTMAVCLMAFALPPLWSLRAVPPLRVLRRDLGPGRVGGGSGLVAGAAGLALLIGLYSRDAVLTAGLLGGLAVIVATLGGGVWLLLRQGMRPAAGPGRGRLRLALASLRRHAVANAVQVAVFALALMLVLVLTLVRTHLVGQWQAQLPPETPNHFVIDILPEQATAVSSWLEDHGLGTPALYPIVRGRLVGVDGMPLAEHLAASGRTGNDPGRELNLTWRKDLPPDNEITAGRWWAPDRDDRTRLPPVSVEAGLARRLGIGLGDRLGFRIADTTLSAIVTSLRTVDWDNMRPNFYMIFPPGVLEDQPQRLITSLYVAPEGHSRLDALVRAFPNLNVIAMDAVIDQIRRIIGLVSAAIELVLGLVVASCVLVLLAGVQATLDLRIRENALLRALGADKRLIIGGLVFEFATLGLLAGGLASLAAEGTGWYIETRLMGIEHAAVPWLWLLGPTLGLGLITTAGYLGCRRVVATPPLRILRQEG